MKEEDRRAEYASLRAEILQSDRTCLLMMGYLIAAVGLLYSKALDIDPVKVLEIAPLVSLISLVSLWYFSEKRFVILQISSYIAKKFENCKKSDFGWETYRKGKHKIHLSGFYPFTFEVITCIVISLSPVPVLINPRILFLCQEDNSTISLLLLGIWSLITLATCFIALFNYYKYDQLEKGIDDDTEKDNK